MEEVKLDRANNKVIVRGEKAEPSKVIERIRKKYSTNAELISPKPKTNNGEDKKEPQKKDVCFSLNLFFFNCTMLSRNSYIFLLIFYSIHAASSEGRDPQNVHAL